MIPGIEGLRLIVCGGRDYYDRSRVFATLDRIHGQKPIGLIIHGAVPGRRMTMLRESGGCSAAEYDDTNAST